MISKDIIKQLAAEELEDANAKHEPRFHSPHEAYAVLLEEFEELKAEVEYMEFILKNMWQAIKRDNNHVGLCEVLKKTTIQAIQEGIQVIAMCDKAMDAGKKIEAQ